MILGRPPPPPPSFPDEPDPIRWFPAYLGDDYRVFVDKQTTQVSPERYLLAWSRWESPWPFGARTTRTYYDCAGRRTLEVQYNLTTWRGDTYGGETVPEHRRKWEGTVPETIGEIVPDRVCRYNAAQVLRSNGIEPNR